MMISLIGCGEVGHCYAQAWTSAGQAVNAVCDLRQDAGMHARARDCGAVLHSAPGPWLAEADVVVCAVYGHAAQAVAEQALPHMRAGSLYVDLTTAGASDMRAAAEAAARHDVLFADVAIMGAIALLGARTPLLCAGTGAQAAADFMQVCGAPAQCIAGQAGDAVRLKLLRSILTKGLESLAVECLVAAERMGLRSQLYEVLADMDRTPMTTFVDAFVRSHVQHATRRLAEVRESRDQLYEAGLQPLVLDGVESLFARTAQGLEAAQQSGAPLDLPDTVHDRLAWLTKLARQT